MSSHIVTASSGAVARDHQTSSAVRSFGSATERVIDRIMSLELARVTESAAVSASRFRGHGSEKAADQAALHAMWRELNNLTVRGTVVNGEGERDEVPLLFTGEEVGSGRGPSVDVAAHPLEGMTLCAKNMPGVLSVLALAEQGTMLATPNAYYTWKKLRSDRVIRKG
jgi:fructose-1,6-bisphosphatase II / sedoheptulose-1,7-bisphosphatase